MEAKDDTTLSVNYYSSFMTKMGGEGNVTAAREYLSLGKKSEKACTWESKTTCSLQCPRLK